MTTEQKHPSTIQRFEIWLGSKMLYACHSPGIIEDFIGDLRGCEVRVVEGWMNYTDGVFQIVREVERFDWDNRQRSFDL